MPASPRSRPTWCSTRSDLEENQNARRVLEQTVADRLPKVEARLAEAKRLLFNRDREIAELTQGAKRHKLALEEASSINAQQNAADRAPEHRPHHARRPQPRQLTAERREAKLALRSEIEALRTKTREQAALIDRLQRRLGHGYLLPAPPWPMPALPPLRRPRATWTGCARICRKRRPRCSAVRGRAAVEAEAMRAGRSARSRSLEGTHRGSGRRDRAAEGGAVRLRAARRQARRQRRTTARSRSKRGSAPPRPRPTSRPPPSPGCAPSWPQRTSALPARPRISWTRCAASGAGAVPTSGQVRRPQRISNERRLAERVSQIAKTERPALAGGNFAKAAPPESVATEPAKPAANGHTGNGKPAAAGRRHQDDGGETKFRGPCRRNAQSD